MAYYQNIRIVNFQRFSSWKRSSCQRGLTKLILFFFCMICAGILKRSFNLEKNLSVVFIDNKLSPALIPVYTKSFYIFLRKMSLSLKNLNCSERFFSLKRIISPGKSEDTLAKWWKIFPDEVSLLIYFHLFLMIQKKFLNLNRIVFYKIFF